MSFAEPACTQVAPSPGRRPARALGPDLLRRESFGALHYDRASCRFTAVPPVWARLLRAAAERPILEAFAAAPADFPLPPLELATQIAAWRRDGVLDATDRLAARRIDVPHGPGALGGPLVTHVQLTRACNLRCTHCYVDVMAKPAPEELDTARVVRLFAELDAIGSPVVVLAGGEPMLRADFWTLIDALEPHAIDAWLCTNAALIDAAAAERLAASRLRGISVSLDGPDEESHAVLRGPRQFERTTSALARLVEAGAADVQIRVTVTPHNAHRLADFAPLARRLGVDKVVFKPFRQSGLADAAHGLLIDRRRYTEAIERLREAWPDDAPPAELGDGMPTRPPAWTKIIPDFGCVGGTTSATVTWDGRVVACGAVLEARDWTLHARDFADCWGGAPSLASWRGLEPTASCTSCQNYARCGGGCRARATGAGLSLQAPDPWSYCSDSSSDSSSDATEDRAARAGIGSAAARRLTIV
jgi:radical SAM protein with 4Fe4S-binding SPASM domain